MTKLLTRSRFRDGDALGSISGLEWFGFGLNPDISGDKKGDEAGEGEENGEGNGEDLFFMVLFTESTRSRLWSGKGAGSGSGLKEVMGLKGYPVSGGRTAGDESGEANGDASVFTKLLTLSCFREGESECSEGWSWSRSWSSEFGVRENGERTGEKNGEGSGMDITQAEANT